MAQEQELFWNNFPARGKEGPEIDEIVAIKVTAAGDLALDCELLDYGNCEVCSSSFLE
jgi:hypothetical protein